MMNEPHAAVVNDCVNRLLVSAIDKSRGDSLLARRCFINITLIL